MDHDTLARRNRERRPVGRRWNCGSRAPERGALLDLDGGAGLLELALELLGLVLVDALLDGLGGLVDERLGLLEPQAGGRADDLDDLDLLVAGAGEDDVERRLLLGLLGAGAVAAALRGRADRRDRGRGDAELLLESLDALGELEDGDRLELVDPLLGALGHVYSSVVSVEVGVSSAGASAGASATAAGAGA